MKYYIVFLSALLVICGCRQEYHRLLNIESYIQERPDSALTELRAINTSNLISAQERALYSLLKTMALDKNYVDITDLSEIEPAVSYYRHHKKGDHYCTALFYKGRINYNGGDFSSAVSSFQEAEKWADSPYWRSMIFSHLGYTYNKCFNNSEEIACAEKALEIVKKLNNPFAIQQSMSALAAAYLNNRMFRHADSLLVSLCSAEPPYYIAYPQRADLMIKQLLPDYEEIKSLFETGIKNNVEMTVEYLSEYAYALYKTGDKQSAEAIFRKLSQTGKEPEVWFWKGKMLEDEGDFQTALEGRKMCDSLADSLVREKLSQSIFKAQAAQYKLESELATQKRKQTCFLSIFTILVLLMISSYIIRRFRRKQRALASDLERLGMIAEESESMLQLAREDLVDTRSKLDNTESKLLELRRLYARTYQAQFAEIGQMFDYCRAGTSPNRKVIENYKEYNGVCRFELNLTSKKQIREALCLTGNTLEEVLNAERNPIQDFLGDVLAEDPAGKAVTNWNTFEKYAVLAACGFDLARVEAKVRQYRNPRSTSIPKMMASFREILAGLSGGASTWTKEKLQEVVR